MTALTSVMRCHGCGYVAGPADPCPFRCPRAGTDDTDHVLTRVLDPSAVRFPAAPAANHANHSSNATNANPFLRYRTLMHSYHVAAARGLPDAAYRDLVAALDASVAAVDGRGFRATPFSRSPELSEALGFSEAGGVWVKDETGNVSGSHKGRHLMGVLIHLAVMERLGSLDPARRRALAIASCGNAALAAAVVARAGGWPLTVFVPPQADAGLTGRLRDLRARVVVCPREPGALGDPTYLALRRELDHGALPFTTQGPENGLAIEGGQTLGYELATDLGHDRLDHLIVQVGGGALASATIQALREAAELGAITRLPRIHTVQTAGAHPLERAYRRVQAELPGHPTPSAIHQAMADAARHRSAFMQPWAEEPRSVATGILDDETYDWRAVVEGMLLTGGRPLVVCEDSLVQANRLAVARTGIPVDPTGSSGLAGLVELRRSGEIGDRDRVAVLFTGHQRELPSAPEGHLMTKRTYGGPLIDVAGAVDLHCHPFPDLFPRLADDFDIVRAARDAGLKAIMLKCHHENTVSRAYLVQRVIPGIRVFGGIVLNYYVGGINAAAVEASLKLGGKEVWMPTVDAGYHAEVHGGTGGYDSQAGGRSQAEGIWVADKEGKLKGEVKEVLELVAQYGAILATSHLAPREIVALVREARSVGVEKIVITHPYFRVPNLDLDTLEEVARMGAMPEFGYCTVSPAWQYAAPEKIVQSVERIGASRCLLVSDTGQRHNPLPSEALRIFAQTIFEKGVPMDKVTRMITDNPLQLLDVDADYQPSAEDLAWARGLVEDPCAGLPAQPAPVLQVALAPAPAAPAAPSANGPS
jgi:threonine synthase